MKPIKPGESTTIPFIIDRNKRPSDYDIAIEFTLRDTVGDAKTYMILLMDLDEGVDEK